MAESGVTPFLEMSRDAIQIPNKYITSTFAEFLGTFILCLFAVGAGCQADIMSDTYIIPVFGGVLGLMVAITICGGASGGHINPAVSLAAAMTGGLSWKKLPLYWIAQFFGAYCGSGLAWALYIANLKDANPRCGDDLTTCPSLAFVFAPMPNSRVGIAFLDQVIGTCLLVMVILAACDKRNMRIPSSCYGPLFAVTIAGINFAFGINAGGVLNPARDIGARLMAVSVGFTAEKVFSYQPLDSESDKPYWLAPLFGPLVGGIVGAVFYVCFIAAHLQDTVEEVREKSRRFKSPAPSMYNDTV